MIHYTAPTFLFNRHLETIYPSLFRKVDLIPYQRERIQTPDDDFLDLDWLKKGADKLVIISHGLEGNTSRSYIKGMAKAFHQNDFDVLTWNFRGCGEETNKQLRFYHSGATDDLTSLINHVSTKYKSIYLIGFSLGGNLTLKFLGEIGEACPILKKAVVFSVPLDLHMSCLQISQPGNWVYEQRFLKSLKAKVIEKAKQYPALDVSKLKSLTRLIDFDDHFTAPIHGFSNAIDYYTKCSSIGFLDSIKVPTLIVNAKNDPFLSEECFPNLLDHSYVKSEYPERGGHVGFAQFNQNGLYWSELRALEFIQKNG
jgi:predicted alpha/beta-fold hydrolase